MVIALIALPPWVVWNIMMYNLFDANRCIAFPAGDLIIDLDADIEKTTSTTLPPTLSSSVKQQPSSIVQAPAVGSPLKASQAGGAASLLHPNTMAVEHSATVDKGTL